MRKKSGYSKKIGAINNKHTVSAIAPKNPKIKDTWTDTVNIKVKRWSGTEWLVIL